MPESPSVLSSPAGCVGIWLSPAAGWTGTGGSSSSPPAPEGRDPWDFQSMVLKYPEQSWPRTRSEITSGPGQAENPINCLVALWFVCLLHLNKYSSRLSLSKLQLGYRSGIMALKACQESCFFWHLKLCVNSKIIYRALPSLVFETIYYQGILCCLVSVMYCQAG